MGMGIGEKKKNVFVYLLSVFTRIFIYLGVFYIQLTNKDIYHDYLNTCACWTLDSMRHVRRDVSITRCQGLKIVPCPFSTP